MKDINDDEFKALIEKEYHDTYDYYRQYFATLDFGGISRFIMGADELFGSFMTSPESFGEDEQLFKARRRAIVTALLEHPAANQLEGDITALAELAGVGLPIGEKTVH